MSGFYIEQPGGSLVYKDLSDSRSFSVLSGKLPGSNIFTARLLRAYLNTQTKLLVENSKWDDSCCSEHTQTIKTLCLWLRFLRSGFHAWMERLHLSMWAKKILSWLPQRLRWTHVGRWWNLPFVKKKKTMIFLSQNMWRHQHTH